MSSELTRSFISPEAARLFSATKSQKYSEDGYPEITRSDYKGRIAKPKTRMIAVLELFRYYYFRKKFRNGHLAYEIIPWEKKPTVSLEASTPDPEVLGLSAIYATTTDPETAVELLHTHTEATFEATMHPNIQLKWKEKLDKLDQSAEFKSRLKPEVQYLLTKEGQALWFINVATDEKLETKDRIKAMVEAGKIQGHYSEKLRLLHEGLPDTHSPQHVTNNNLIVGTDITNKFRRFMQERVMLDTPKPDNRQLTVHPDDLLPDEPPEPPAKQDENIIDVEPEQALPDFLT